MPSDPQPKKSASDPLYLPPIKNSGTSAAPSAPTFTPQAANSMRRNAGLIIGGISAIYIIYWTISVVTGPGESTQPKHTATAEPAKPVEKPTGLLPPQVLSTGRDDSAKILEIAKQLPAAIRDQAIDDGLLTLLVSSRSGTVHLNTRQRGETVAITTLTAGDEPIALHLIPREPFTWSVDETKAEINVHQPDFPRGPITHKIPVDLTNGKPAISVLKD